MRRFYLATAMLVCPGVAAAQSQCAVTKPSEPFIALPAPVDVTGRPVLLTPRSPSQSPPTQEAQHAERTGPTQPQPVPSRVVLDQADPSEVPVLRHIASAGATLTDLGASHGLRTVVARHGGEFMIFQVASDGQAAVAGLMTDLSVDQLKAVSGSALTELDAQHGLRSFFLRNGSRFQVFYATPDDQRVVPGVMWDAAGQDVTRKAIASIPGAIPTVTVGEAAANARVMPAIATSPSASPVSLTDTAYGTSGKPSAPELWVFVDPQCSFSIRAMQALQPYVDAGRVRLHLIPLSILDGEDNGLSTEHALDLVSTPPDQMLAAWEAGQYVAGAASEAAPKLATNMAAAAASQVRGTPTFFWRKPDGGQGRLDGVPNNMGALVAALGS